MSNETTIIKTGVGSITVLIICFAGEPDLIDATINLVLALVRLINRN